MILFLLWRRIRCFFGFHELHIKFEAKQAREYTACAWCDFETDGWVWTRRRRQADQQ